MLHQNVTHVIELRRLALALAKQLRLWLVRGYMRLIRPPLAVEVYVRVASRGGGSHKGHGAAHSAALSRNMNSAGNRLMLRLTA